MLNSTGSGRRGLGSTNKCFGPSFSSKPARAVAVRSAPHPSQLRDGLCAAPMLANSDRQPIKMVEMTVAGPPGKAVRFKVPDPLAYGAVVVSDRTTSPAEIQRQLAALKLELLSATRVLEGSQAHKSQAYDQVVLAKDQHIAQLQQIVARAQQDKAVSERRFQQLKRDLKETRALHASHVSALEDLQQAIAADAEEALAEHNASQVGTLDSSTCEQQATEPLWSHGEEGFTPAAVATSSHTTSELLAAEYDTHLQNSARNLKQLVTWLKEHDPKTIVSSQHTSINSSSLDNQQPSGDQDPEQPTTSSTRPRGIAPPPGPKRRRRSIKSSNNSSLDQQKEKKRARAARQPQVTLVPADHLVEALNDKGTHLGLLLRAVRNQAEQLAATADRDLVLAEEVINQLSAPVKTDITVTPAMIPQIKEDMDAMQVAMSVDEVKVLLEGLPQIRLVTESSANSSSDNSSSTSTTSSSDSSTSSSSGVAS